MYRKLLKLFFQKISQLLLTAMMLIYKPFFDFTEHCIQLPHRLVVTTDEFLLDKSKLIRKIHEGFSLLISLGDFSTDHFFGREETLILLDKMVSSMLGNALHTDIFLISFTEKAEGLIMIGTELVIFAYLFFLACKLKRNIVFSEISGLDLRTVLVATGRTIEHFLFFINNEKTLLTDSMTAIEVTGDLFLGVIQVIAHGALHS